MLHTPVNISYVNHWTKSYWNFRDNSIEPVDAERLSEFVKLRAYEKITLLPPVRLSQMVSYGTIRVFNSQHITIF